MPFAWMLGVEESECQHAGELLALKMLVNEYVAYAKLAEKIEVRSITVNAIIKCNHQNFAYFTKKELK